MLEIVYGKIVIVNGRKQIATGMHYCCENGHWIFDPKTNTWESLLDHQKKLIAEGVEWEHMLRDSFAKGYKWYGLVNCPEWIDKLIGDEFLYACDKAKETGVPVRYAYPHEQLDDQVK